MASRHTADAAGPNARLQEITELLNEYFREQ
jgi:hypothetical protein